MDLKSVPFFNRPMQARETDQWVGLDDAGNNVYKMDNGSTYTVKPSADQRTTRTKVEEDLIPAAKEFIQDPSLPSAEQMKQFGADVVEGTYESIKGAVEGTGTMGDVFGVAPAMAVASSVAEVPEGAVRLFGGKKATDPGYTRSGSPAPESVGADKKYRFEIDDSQSVVVPGNYSEVTFDPNFSPKDTSTFTFLDDGLIHDDFFYQYPELKDVKVVFNTALPTDTLGAFYPQDNLISLNSSYLDPSQKENLRRTLLHEIQHIIQEKEGFVQGTNPRSTEVGQITYQRINSPENASAWEGYEDAVKAHKQPENLRVPITKAKDFLEAYAREAGYRLSEPNFFQRVTDKVKAKDLDPIQAQFLVKASKELDFLERNLEGLDPQYFDYYTGRLDTLYSNLASLAKTDAPELFTKVTGLDAEELLNWKKSSSSNSFVHIFSPPPLQPELPPPGTNPVQNAVLQSTYERKRGEVEARNVGERLYYDLEARFQVTPEETEDFPRSEQWGEFQNYNQGGLVPMDEQMSQFNDEKIDPVSGNEVPPGSLPEEVRDDVDAKLSEGEYVVPADVVRYFGVGYFEKLREKAKKALAEMDADGRIGGEPMLEDGDDFPFSEDELMTLEEEVVPVQMAEGGVVAQGFNPANFTAGFSSQGSGVQIKTFMNKEGQQRSIMFVNDQPIQQIPAGFVEATAENRAELTKQQPTGKVPTGEVSVEEVREERDGGGFDGAGSGGASTEAVGIGTDIGTPEGGYGKMGAGATVGLGALAGLAFGGIKGAIAGGKEGKDIADFNDARNALAEAVQSNDISAIGKAAKDVEETFAELGKVGKVATNTLGLSAKDAVNAVGYAAQGAGTSSRGDFGYGLTEGEQAAASNSFGGMSASDPGYADPYGAGFGPGGVNRGGGDAETGGFGVGSQGAADVDAAVGEAMGGGYGGGGSSAGGNGGESGYGGGYGGYAARGMLVDKKVKQKPQPKPAGKGLVKRKPKNK